MEGKVIFFSAKKGWGFIAQDNGQPDLFVHFSKIKGMTGYKELMAGQAVSYLVEQGPKLKPQATEVFVLEE